MKNDNKFKENEICFTFGAISDIHLTDGGDDSEKKFRQALKTLSAFAENGLDAVLCVGDLIDSRKESQIEKFKAIYEDELSYDVPLIYCLGDGHDEIWTEGDDAPQTFARIFGEEYFKKDVNMEMVKHGNRHCIINGCHIIALQPISRCPIRYGDKTKAWLKKTLEQINDENGKMPIIVITHPMIHNTCYGSCEGDEWDTEELTPILSDYEQIIVFGGHLHFPLIDERSIMQTEFTSVGCGAVRYMAIEHAYMFQHGYNVKNAYRFSQGLLCEVDSGGNVRITRLDFLKGRIIKSPWMILKGEKRYVMERMQTASAPCFDGDGNITARRLKNEMEQTTCQLSFNAAYDADFVHHYEIAVENEHGTVIMKRKLITDFFRVCSADEMAKRCSADVGDILREGYTVYIQAVNSWGKKSKPINRTF
ncbi:MAG: metallophosphoesterase [Clostridia bacterium]|nr:metallophosphoesterase [Clostridia bacterium]